MSVLLNAAASAVNAAIFVQNASPVNLGAAVFCGLMTICFAVVEA